MYDAYFTLETLYDVSRHIQGFVSSQECSVDQLINETRRVERDAQDAVYVVRDRLEKEKTELQELKRQLENAQWELSRYPETNEDGGANSDYEYWARAVEEWECKVNDQEEEVARVESAYEDVSAASEDAIARCRSVFSQTQLYKESVSSKAYAASQAINKCADVMQDYWNIKL